MSLNIFGGRDGGSTSLRESPGNNLLLVINCIRTTRGYSCNSRITSMLLAVQHFPCVPGRNNIVPAHSCYITLCTTQNTTLYNTFRRQAQVHSSPPSLQHLLLELQRDSWHSAWAWTLKCRARYCIFRLIEVACSKGSKNKPITSWC